LELANHQKGVTEVLVVGRYDVGVNMHRINKGVQLEANVIPTRCPRSGARVKVGDHTLGRKRRLGCTGNEVPE